MFGLMANCFAWIKRKKEPTSAITLVIIGLDDAGKTTMVASLQGEPPDGITPTIGFANAEFTINNFKVTVYDLGGGVRIRDVWRNYYAEVFGVVFVVDSCNLERLEESKDVMQQVAEHTKITGKPFLVFANKQDKIGALADTEICDILDLEGLSSKNGFTYKVVSCSALKGFGRNVDKNINSGFNWLLSTISGEFSKISARVERDVAIKKEEDERERKARGERIRKIREERDRLEREAGIDPDKEDTDDENMMENPFQPIGKHLENVKAMEKKKKTEKKKSMNSGDRNVNRTEDIPQEKEPENIIPVIKKKRKKKKKKLAKATDNSELDQNDPSVVAHTSFEAEIKHLHEPNSEKHSNVVKKKKQKTKIIHEENEEDNSQNICKVTERTNYFQVEENMNNHRREDKIDIVDDLDVTPRKKKQKKKKKASADLDVKNCEDAKAEACELEDIDHRKNDSPHIADKEAVRKPKIKKRKKKKNRTVPSTEEMMAEDTSRNDVLPAPAWNTSPRTWTSLPPIGKNGEGQSGNLPPLHGQNALRGIGESSSTQKLSTSPSWTRARPNSEDLDIVT